MGHINRFLQEAIRIGDDILSLKKENDKGYSWETMSVDKDHNIIWKQDESIYSGVGGIVLFFIELYKQTFDLRFFEAAEKGSDWLIDNFKANLTYNYSFFTGRMGLTYVFAQMYKLTGNREYIKHSTRIALDSSFFFKAPFKVNDLLNGSSGILLGLLYLHNITRDEKLIPIINQFTKHLIENIHHGINGIYWDRNVEQTNGLCGFSHGAAGIAYVFLELGSYFNNPVFYWVAKQAFEYENYFYENCNWPDFRKGISKKKDLEKYKKAFINNELSLFNTLSYATAWCHGAPGIGFARLLGWQLLDENKWKIDLDRALKQTEYITSNFLQKPDNNSFNLCHGKGGNAILFIENYKQLGNRSYWKLAKSIAEEAIAFRKKNNFYISGLSNHAKYGEEDISLFLGNAGIGYFFLMCANPSNVPTILAPRVGGRYDNDISKFDILSLDLIQIKKKTISRAFPRTISLIENDSNYINLASKYFKGNTKTDVKKAFILKTKEIIQKNDGDEFEYLNNILNIEKIKLDLSLDTNPAYQQIKTIITNEKINKILKLKNNELIDLKFILNSDLRVIKTNCDLKLIDERTSNNDKEKESSNNDYHYYVFIKSPKITIEYTISYFSYLVLNYFSNPSRCGDVFCKILNEFNYTNNQEGQQIKELFLSQMRECVHSKFLIRVESN